MTILRFRCGEYVEPPIEDPNGSHVEYADHERIVRAKDAEIEQLKQQLAAPRLRSKKQKIEEALRQSDLTAQIVGRTDVEYGHHDSLPRGEHVANLRKGTGESE